jgi:hypothetical protein
MAEAEKEHLIVSGWRNDLVDASAAGEVQRAMWDRGIIAFRATAVERATAVDVTVLAISDA